MDPSTSSSSSSCCCLIIIILLFVFPNFIPHEGARQYITQIKRRGGGIDTRSDFSMSDLSD